MIGKVHRFGGICVGLATSYYLLGDKSDVITLMAGTMLGSAGALLPDIDNKDSIVSRQFPKLSGCVRKLTAHRQFTHSLIIPCLIAIFCYYIQKQCPVLFIPCLCFLAGYLMHLIQDFFTKGGTPWLYPIKKWRYSISPFRTGSKVEWVFTTLLLFGYIELLHYYVANTWLCL